MLRGLLWCLAALVLSLLILVSALALLGSTQTGTQWVWAVVQRYLPQGVTVAQVDGQLLGQLELSDVRVEQDGLRLTLEYAGLQWRPRELLGGVLHVHRVALRGLDYTALAAAPAEDVPPEPFEPPAEISLPLSVVLGEFLLEDARFHAAPDAEPFVVDTLRFAATLGTGEWQITELTGSGPLFALSGTATLEPDGQFANTFQIDWTLRPPDLAALSGTTTLGGDLEQVELALVIDAPYSLTASAVVSEPFGRLRLDADATLDALQLSAVRDDLPDLALALQASASGTPTDLQFALGVTGTQAVIGTGQLELSGRYAGDSIRIDDLRLTSPDAPGFLQGAGTVALGVDAEVDLSVDWQGLQWPLAGAADYASPTGKATITGTPDDYRLVGALTWDVRLDRPQSGRLSVFGRGSTQAFELERLALTGAAGEVTGGASVAWAPALAIKARLEGSDFNPGAFAPQWPGGIDFTLTGEAQQRPDGLHAAVEQLRAEGHLRDQPLQVEARATRDPLGTAIEQFVVTMGATRLQATGAVAEELDIAFTLNSDDLGATLPGAAGRVTASGRASGPLRRPRVGVELDASDLVYRGDRLAGATLDADIDVSGARESRLALQLTKGLVNGERLDALALTGSGTPGDHELVLDADGSFGGLDLAVSGALPDTLDTWRFELESAQVQYARFDAWRLAAPAAGVVGGTRQALERACFTSGAALACLEGERIPTGAVAEFSLRELPFDYLRPLLPDTLALRGNLSAEGSLSAPADGAMRASLALRTSAGTLSTVAGEGEAVTLLALAPGRMDADLEGLAVSATLDLPLAERGGLRGALAIAPGTAPVTERALSGELTLEVGSLGVIPELTGEIDALEGRMTGEMSLGGTLSAPELHGVASLTAQRLDLATPGLEISDLVLGLNGRGETLDVSLSARSGEGTLDVTGEVALATAGWSADFTVRGDEFQVVGTPEARLWASPDLRVGLSAERMSIDGTLAVPRGEITPQNLPETGAITVSRDQVILLPGGDATAASVGPELHANLRVVIGDPNLRVTEVSERGRNFDDILRRLPGEKVLLEGFGLRSVLAGELLVAQGPSGPATGSGELRVVVGEYKAYGQDLTIRDGRILFSGGPVTEPAVNISAYRQPQDDVLVGVRVRGALERPRLSVYSEPANMTQSEQLAWLVLGRPLSGASSSETSLVTQAALALGLKGGNMVTGNIRDAIGVDELGLESQETTTGEEQAALVIGKYLTPKLYVSYGIGLFEPLSTVRMRYTLTERWHLETQSTGTESGGDIIFAIERGGVKSVDQAHSDVGQVKGQQH